MISKRKEIKDLINSEKFSLRDNFY